MKLLTYVHEGMEKVGVLSACGTYVYPVNYASMNELIKNACPNCLKNMAELANKPHNEVENAVELANVQLIAPIPEPMQDIICLGVNYADHAEESARFKKQAYAKDSPKQTVYFSKRVNLAVEPYGDIPAHEDLTSQLDYEAELVVIIGKDAKNVKPEDVHDHIFGYTIMNDVTAREVQNGHKQWYFGKSLDGFTPIGPWIVTKDEIAYPPQLNIQSKVNGELRQNSNTGLFLTNIEEWMVELSQGMTLKAGTLVATGTPAGVGMGFVPPNFLKVGDEVECIIEGIGSIKNKIVK